MRRTGLSIVFLLLAWKAAAGDVSLVETGEKCFMAGRMAEAADLLEQAAAASPRDPRILSGLGRAYFHLGERNEAKDCLNLAMSSFPAEDWVGCWSAAYLGKIHALEGQFDEARQWLLFAANPVNGTTPCVREARKFLAYARLMSNVNSPPWKTWSGPRLALHCAETGQYRTDELGREALGHYRRIAGLLLGSDAKAPRIHVYIHSNRRHFDIWDAKEAIAKYRPGECHLSEDTVGYLPHEMTHLIMAALPGAKQAAPWISEGLAEYMSGSPWGTSLDVWVAGFRKTGDYIPLHQIMDPRQFRNLNPVIAYEEAGAFVQYLIETLGFARFRKAIGVPRPMDVLADVREKDLESEWLESIDRLTPHPDTLAKIRYRVAKGRDYLRRSYTAEFDLLPETALSADSRRDNPEER